MNFLKRVWHIALIAVGLAIPTIAALSDSTGELGKYGGAGMVAIALIGVAVNVKHSWNPPESAVYKRWLSMLGTAANVAAPILMFLYTRMPATTKGYAFIGTAAALAASWKGAFAPQLALAPAGQPAKDAAADGAGQ